MTAPEFSVFIIPKYADLHRFLSVVLPGKNREEVWVKEQKNNHSGYSFILYLRSNRNLKADLR